MIRRLRIRGYKSLEDVELVLPSTGLAVIIGPNAAGKSNLFDALRLLSGIVTKRNLKEAFEDHRGAPLEAFHLSKGDLSALLAQDELQFSIEADVRLSDEATTNTVQRITEMRRREGAAEPRHVKLERLLRYSITVAIQPKTGHLMVVDESLTALRADLREKQSRTKFVERVGDRLHLRMEGQAHPFYYDTRLDYSLLSAQLYPPHYPHISAFRDELSRWRFFYFSPAVMREETPLKDVSVLGQNGADLAAFFHSLRARNEKQFDSVCRSLRELIPAAENLRVEPTQEGFVRLSLIEGGVAYSSRLISEGTLRVLGLLAILHPTSALTTIGFEEPENGVHPRRLSQVARLLKVAAQDSSRQILINTHSAKLPEFFDPGDLIVCRREGHRTVFEPFKTFGPLFKAQDINRALEETPVSERILRGDFGG